MTDAQSLDQRRRSAPLRVTYLVGSFPVLSETFVIQEILDHLDAGVDVSVIAFDRSAPSAASAVLDDPRLAGRVDYLDIPRSARSKLGAIAACFLGAPRSAFRALTFLRPGAASAATFLLAAKLPQRKLDFDILHVHFGNFGYMAAAVRERIGISGKLVVTVHGFDMSKGGFGGSDGYYKTLAARADLILPVNDLWREKFIASGSPPEKIVVHHMGVAVEKLKAEPVPRPGGAGEPFRIASTGRLVEKKGHRYSIEALARLRAIQPDLDVRLSIAGDGPLASELQQMTRRLGLDDKVHFHGALSHSHTLDLVRSSDVFMLPSVTAEDGNMEGIPVSLMEAMALGRPVLSTWHSGIPELVTDGVSGLLVAERDVDGLAHAIVRLALDEQLRGDLARAGRAKVVEDFNAKALGGQLRKMYRSLLTP